MKLIHRTYNATYDDVGIVSQNFTPPAVGARLLSVKVYCANSADFPFTFATIWVVGEPNGR